MQLTRRLRLAHLATVLALFALALPTALAAQDRAAAASIGSDRPGLGDGSHLLGVGVWQLEAGATIADAGDSEIQGSALVRWGIAPLELRFYLPSPIVSRGDNGLDLGDVGIGLKTRLAQGAWSWSLVAAATLPTGTDAATADEAGTFATVIGETALTSSLAFALNFGYAATFDGFGDGAFSVIATPALALADGISAYAGYAGTFDSGNGPNAHMFEAGLALARDADTQWDINAGWDLESESWFFGVGTAMRWR